MSIPARSFLPLPAQKPVYPGIRNLAVHNPTFSQVAFFLKAEPFESPGRRQVAWVNIGFEAVEVQGLESVIQEGLQGLGDVP